MMLFMRFVASILLLPSTIALAHRSFLSQFPATTAPARLVARQNGACNMNSTDGAPPLCLQNVPVNYAAQSSNNATVTSPPASTGPTPSCSLQNEDPDQGITSEYCIREGSKTLPLLTPASTAVATESCAYKSLPTSGSEITPTTGFHSTTTNSALCEICSQVVINEDSCTTISNCLPEKAQATVQAGSSPVHVGTLTGEALYASISSALDQLCPSVTQTESMTSCSTDSVTIGDIDYVDGGSLAQDGELVVKVDSSAYNDTNLRNAMINSAALTANNSAQGSRCYSQSYTVEELRKREISSQSFWADPLGNIYRGLQKRDHPYPVQESQTFCNAASFAGVQYYNQFWRLAPNPGSSDYIDAEWSFQAGPGGDFDCEFLSGLIDALGIIEPEFMVADIELGKAIDAVCTLAMEHGS